MTNTRASVLPVFRVGHGAPECNGNIFLQRPESKPITRQASRMVQRWPSFCWGFAKVALVAVTILVTISLWLLFLFIPVYLFSWWWFYHILECSVAHRDDNPIFREGVTVKLANWADKRVKRRNNRRSQMPKNSCNYPDFYRGEYVYLDILYHFLALCLELSEYFLYAGSISRMYKMNKMRSNIVKPIAVSIAGILLLCGMLMPLSLGCNNEVLANGHNPDEFIVLSYRLNGRETLAIQDRYASANAFVKEEMYFEVGALLGLQEQTVTLSYAHPQGGLYDTIMRVLTGGAVEVTVSQRFLVSEKKGFVRELTEEELLSLGDDINVIREAEFMARIQKLMGNR